MLGRDDPAYNPIMIGDGDKDNDEHDVLINLADDVPVFFGRFRRLIECVDHDESVKTASRERFRYYREHGYRCKPARSADAGWPASSSVTAIRHNSTRSRQTGAVDNPVKHDVAEKVRPAATVSRPIAPPATRPAHNQRRSPNTHANAINRKPPAAARLRSCNQRARRHGLECGAERPGSGEYLHVVVDAPSSLKRRPPPTPRRPRQWKCNLRASVPG